jgi:hypothetical protein
MLFRSFVFVLTLASSVPAAAQQTVSAATAPTGDVAAPEVPPRTGPEGAAVIVQTNVPPPSGTSALPPAASDSPVKKVVARWFDLQNATLNLRYRFVENSNGVFTTNQLQHRETLRGRIKFDAPARYSLNFGVATGVRFTSGWDNTGWGINPAQKNLAVKALYVSAQPWKGVEGQVGGLYIIKGESTEITTYDEDGFITGERLSIKRPDKAFFDEISVTSAYFVGGTGPNNIPVSTRLPHFNEQHYHHFLVDKKFGRRVGLSTDYTRENGRFTWREAANVKIPESRLFDSVIVELYQRTNTDADHGFAVTLDKAVTRTLSMNGGYASIDPKYGPLNADRFNIGNRIFIMATYTFSPELLASFFITTAVGHNGVLPQQTMSNTVLTYNVVPLIKRSGLF